MPTILLIALILNLGVFAFWLAWRCKLPAIVLLLVFGSAFGRALGAAVPQSELEKVLPVLLGTTVALLYCDGGRSLRGRPLGQDGKLVGHLVGWGAKLGWIGISLLAHFVLGLQATEALFLGALLMVSAPYMVEPLVEHLKGDARIALILRWDAYLLSCIGVAWAVLLLGALEAHQGEPRISKTIAITFVTALVGLVVGYVGTQILKYARQHLPEWLFDPATVGLTLLCFSLSQCAYWGSGLVACMSLGYLSARGEESPSTQHFWNSLQIIYIGLLGIYLGMMVGPAELVVNWPQRLIFALLVVLLVRPLLAKIGARHGLTPREHLLISITWPRGALTLATATLVATRLKIDHPQAATLIPITFWVVLVSVLVPWVLGPWLLRRYPQQTDSV